MNGSPLKSYGLDWYELFQRCFGVGLIVWAAGVLILPRLPPSLSSLDSESYTALSAGIGLLIFLVYGLYEQSRRPRITLYENGIGTSQHGEEKFWRWNQITRMDGTRHYTYIYGILRVGGYGFNQFYAGTEPAFRVEVMTAGASELVNFAFMKMAEVQLPAFIQSYQRGETLTMGGFNLIRQGIVTAEGTIPWSEVQSVAYRDETFQRLRTSILIRREGKRGQQKLSESAGIALYVIMGVFDSILHTHQLSETQEQRLKGGLHLSRRAQKMVLLYGGIILVAIGALVAQDWIKQQNLQQEQTERDEFASRFGPDISALCSPVNTLDETSNPIIVPSPRYVVMDVNEDHVYHPFDALLTDAQRATSRQDLTTSVCVDLSPHNIETCSYEDHQSYYKNGVYRFDVHRYRRDMDVYIVDIQSSTLIAETILRGTTPGDCPSTASVDQPDIYGQPPDADTFARWFQSVNAAPRAANVNLS